MSAPSLTELRATLITLVAGATETRGTKEKLVGDVETLPIVFKPRCNRRLPVNGTNEDRDVLERAIELLRDAPYDRPENSPGG